MEYTNAYILTMKWKYKGREYNPPEDFTPSDLYGFVYCITNRATNKKYIGKKNFWKPKILPKNTKRKRRIRTRVGSDWRTYFGSSGLLTEKVQESGQNAFKRVILRLRI